MMKEKINIDLYRGFPLKFLTCDIKTNSHLNIQCSTLKKRKTEFTTIIIQKVCNKFFNNKKS